MNVIERLGVMYLFNAGVWAGVSGVAWVVGRVAGERARARRIEEEAPPRSESRQAAFTTLTQSFAALALVQTAIAVWMPAPPAPAGPATVPGVLLEVAATMVAFDFLFYASHRVLHGRILWPVHAIHHRFRFVTFWVRNTDSFAQVPIVALFTLPLSFVPLHMPSKVAFFVVSTVWSVLQHSGHEVFPRSKVLARVLVTPTHHSMHHTEQDCNFAYFFTFWDDVFRTLHPRYRERFLGQKVIRG